MRHSVAEPIIRIKDDDMLVKWMEEIGFWNTGTGLSVAISEQIFPKYQINNFRKSYYLSSGAKSLTRVLVHSPNGILISNCCIPTHIWKEPIVPTGELVRLKLIDVHPEKDDTIVAKPVLHDPRLWILFQIDNYPS